MQNEMSEECNYQLYNGLYDGDLLYYNKSINAHERYQMLLQKKIQNYIDGSLIETVADIGCSCGIKSVLVAEKFPQAKILATDFAEKGIAKATSHYASIPNLEFRVEDVLDSSNPARKFDMICAFEIIEHIEDWKSFVNTMASKASKYILLSVPSGRMRKYESLIGHYRNFQRGEIEKELLDYGFRPIKTYYAGLPFWSPISRDLLNKTFKNRDHSSTVEINKLFHGILFFLYRFCCLRNIGDQFMGLFKKE